MSQIKINADCPCTYTSCPRHGNCVECRKNHSGSLTSCQKLKAEKK